MTQPIQRILVWGVSPIAAWISAALERQNKFQVRWLADATVEADVERTNGILTGPSQQPQPINVLTELDTDVDLIILAAPGWHTADAVAQLRQQVPLDQSPPPILSLQMGVGNVERIDNTFGPGHSIAGVVTWPIWYGSYHENKPVRSHIITVPVGGVGLQASHPLSGDIARIMRQLGMQVKPAFTDSITWSSVFWGVQTNALSAILDVAPYEIYRNREWFEFECRQIAEALQVIDRLGVRLVPLPDVNVRQMANVFRRMPKRFLTTFLMGYPRPPSLRDDLRFEHGRSEAAYLNGAIAVHGHDLGIATPINHALALALTDIAEGRQSWDEIKEDHNLLGAMLRVAQ